MKHKSLNFDDAGKIDVFVPGVPGKRKLNYQITDVLFHFIHNVAFYEVIQLKIDINYQPSTSMSLRYPEFILDETKYVALGFES